jgi:hypothetical protein
MEDKDQMRPGFCLEGIPASQVQREATQRRHTMSNERSAFTVLSSLAGTDLCWVKSREPACVHFQLRAGSDVVASLRFRDPLGTAATGESANGAWFFVEEGLLRPYVSVRTGPGETPLAAYRSTLLGFSGYLDFIDGRRFCWRRLGVRTPACCFDNAQGAPLVAVEVECCRSWLFGSRLIGGNVRVEPDAYMLSELMLLVLLSWYLVVLPRHEARFQILP